MTTKNYGLLTDPDKFEIFVDRLIAADLPVGFDIETGYFGEPREKLALYPHHPDWTIVGFSFTNDPSWARYVPLFHPETSANMDVIRAGRALWKLLNNTKVVAHNLAFEYQCTAAWFRKAFWDDEVIGEAVRASFGYWVGFSDTMIEAYLDASYPKNGLKFLVKAIFNHTMTEFDELFEKKSKKNRFNSLDTTPKVVDYACEDSAWCLALHQHFYPTVSKMFLYQVEMETVRNLCDMEDYGLYLDWEKMRQDTVIVSRFLGIYENELLEDIRTATGNPEYTINFGSPVQVAKMLYDDLGLPVLKTTDKGGRSTDALALVGLASKSPIVQKILSFREIKVLISRYIDKYERDQGYDPAGKVHPNHMQTVVSSGRFAVSEFPYQQWPKWYEYESRSGDSFRINCGDYIICPPNHYGLGWDLSQVELRVTAGLSQEPTLLENFLDGSDVHRATTSLMLGVPLEEVTKELRQVGKTLNFALLYGLTASSLADRLVISRIKAQELFDSYFATFSRIHAWVEKVTAEGTKQGFVHTPFGRKVTIWELQSNIRGVFSKGERLCVNAPVQGGAADYMKISMVRVWRTLKKHNLLDRVHPVMNVHDALEFYVHESVDRDYLIGLLAPDAEFAVPGFPPIVAEWHTWLKYGSKEELGSWAQMRGEGTQAPKEISPHPGDPKPAISPLKVQEVPKTAEEMSRGVMYTLVFDSLPTADQFGAVIQVLNLHPGSGKVTFVTPEGSLPAPTAHYLDAKARSALNSAGVHVEVTGDPENGTELLNGVDLSDLSSMVKWDREVSGEQIDG